MTAPWTLPGCTCSPGRWASGSKAPHGRDCAYALDPTTHFKVGDAVASMRLACSRPIEDSCWTENPRLVTCPRCEQALDQEQP